MPPSGPSEAQTSPARRLSSPSRRSQACQRCWKRKQKCDRILPRCTSCADLDVECVTRSQDIESLLSDDSGLTHASLRSYIDSLQGLSVSEHNGSPQSPPAKRKRTRSDLDPPASEMISPQATRTAHLSTPAASENLSPVVEDAAVRDTMGAIGFLSNSAMAETRTNAEEASPHKLSLVDLIISALAVAGEDPSKSSSARPDDGLDHQQLPISRENSLEHHNRFMRWTCFLLYLDSSLMFQFFEETMSYHSAQDMQPPPVLQRFTSYVVIATGIMMSKDAGRLTALASSLHSTAVKMLPYILRDQTPLDALHCLAMLVTYSLFSPNGGSAWHLLGIGMKLCITLGLHKESPSPTGVAIGNEYDPRWMFWTFYSLDRMLCSVMDRPFSIREEDITVKIPSPSDDDDGTDEALAQVKAKRATSRHIIGHAQLMSNIRYNSDADPIIAYHGLCFWRDSTPPAQNPPISPHIWTQAADQMACRLMMQIVSPLPQAQSIAGSLRGTANQVEADTLQICTAFINNIYERTNTDEPGDSFLDAYDILSAAIIIACLHHRLERQEPQHFASLMNSMNKATALITQISGRFTALRAFQDTLLKLSAHVMEAQYRGDQAPLKPFQDVPLIVPRRLRRFLSGTFQ